MTNSVDREIASRIRELRAERGPGEAAVADALGVSPEAYAPTAFAPAN